VTKPGELRDTVSEALHAAGPVVVDVTVDPAEIPSMPHLKVEQIARFGIGKLRELISA
jgi:pyruvate dehydrogenase (quinone)